MPAWADRAGFCTWRDGGGADTGLGDAPLGARLWRNQLQGNYLCGVWGVAQYHVVFFLKFYFINLYLAPTIFTRAQAVCICRDKKNLAPHNNCCFSNNAMIATDSLASHVRHVTAWRCLHICGKRRAVRLP